MKRAVIFGAGGFIGRNLAQHMVEHGWDVVATTRDAAGAERLAAARRWSNSIRIVYGSLLDKDWLAQVIASADVIFPMAGHSGAVRSLIAPEVDLHVNVEAQLLLLEVVRLHNSEARLIYPGSRLQYGRCDSLPVSEDTPQSPLSIYGVHKATVESYYRMYHAIHDLQTTVLRISIPYGPHQGRSDRAFGVVGNFISLARSGHVIRIFGNGSQLRDYLYIEDLVHLLRICAEHDSAVGEVFNASGPAPISVLTMARTVVEVVGTGEIVFDDWPALDAAVETGDYYGSIAKAQRCLNWSPFYSLRSGLETFLRDEPTSFDE